jgi:hypothetical protein
MDIGATIAIGFASWGRPDMEIIFQVIDPTGSTIILTDQCWYEHILAFHPAMEEFQEAIKATIVSPLYGMIYSDVDYSDRRIYYSRRGKYQYLKVVVEFDQDRGTVITAFITDRLKSGEKLIWPKSSH